MGFEEIQLLSSVSRGAELDEKMGLVEGGDGSTSVKPNEEGCVECRGLEEVITKSKPRISRMKKSEKKTIVYGRRNRNTRVIIKSLVRDKEYSFRDPKIGEHNFVFDTNTNLETIRRRVIAAGKWPLVQEMKHISM